MEQVSGSSRQNAAVDPADLWKLMGRDTPAARALLKLYAGDRAKTTGQAYHEVNRQRHEAKLAAGWSPKPIQEPPAPVIERPQIDYPRFGHQKTAKAPAVKTIPRRKPATQIVAEMEENRKLMAAQRPVPRGPLLDDKEKERCAALMRYRGKLPEELVAVLAGGSAAGTAKRRQRTAVMSEMDEKSHIFDQIVQEIEERRQFIEDMQAAGALTREMHEMVRCEIKQRVHELEKLDSIIQRDRQPPDARN